MRTTMMVVATATLATSFASGAASAPLPAAVKKDLADIVSMCTDAGGKARTDQAVQRVDLTGDGKEDYVVDTNLVVCEGAASVYGDRAKGILVYVGDGTGGAKSVWSGSVYGSRIEGTGTSAKLWLGVSGGDCGKPPAANFASEVFCERPLAWNAKQGKFEFAPLSTVKILQ